MKTLIEKILRFLARRVINKYNPRVIGITGSVGKTGTRDAVHHVLQRKFTVRRTIGNYNNEIGLPLTVLGMESPGKSFLGWIGVLGKSLGMLLGRKAYPEILVLEMGVDKPGDLDYLLSIVKPNISILTSISEIPVHIEFFQSVSELAKEKSKIMKFLNEEEVAILNFDDERVKSVADKTIANIVTYGFSESVDFKASDVVLNSRDLQRLIGEEDAYQGISFKLHYQDNEVPIRMPNVFGRHQVYSALAAAAVGIQFDMNLIEISEALQGFIPPRGRMHLIPGIKKTCIIDDTYNASPDSTLAALKVLGELKVENGKKIASLGDMLELGEMTEEGHRRIGQAAAKVADVLVAVGEASNFIADAAKKSGMDESKVHHFMTSEEAGMKIQNDILEEGDLLLVKGSQGMRMEKIVKEVMAEPMKAAELLVRQNKKWQKK